MTASKLMKWLPKCLRPVTRRATPRTALGLQTLEAREVPALYTWVGPANGGLWNDTNNWNTPNALGFPNAFDNSVSVVFNGAVSSIQNVDLNLSVDRITFNGNSGTIQLTENLTLDGDASGDQILVTGVGAYSITGTADLVLGGVNNNPFIEVPNGSGLSVSADMTGSRGFTKLGAGALSLLGTSTFTGDSVVRAGVVGLDGGAGNTIPDGTKVTVGGFGVAADIRLDSVGQIANDAVIQLDTNGRLNVSANGNEVTGELILNGGEVAVGTGLLQTATITVLSNSTISSLVQGTDAGKFVPPPAGTTISVAPTATLTVSGKLSGSGTITYTGGGTTAYTNQNPTGSVGVNDYTGLTWVKAGTLVLDDAASNAAFAGNLRIGDGTGGLLDAIVRLDAASELPDGATVTILADGKLDMNGHSDGFTSLVMNGGSQVTTGAGTLFLSGDITASNASFLAAGVFGTVSLSSGQHNITVNGANSELIINGKITGAGGILKAGDGELSLQGTVTNDYAGITTVTGGLLELAHTAGFSAIPHNLLVVPDAGTTATVRHTANAQIDDGADVLVAGGGSLDLNGKSEFIKGLVLGSTAGGGAVTTGAGTLTLGGNVSTLAAPTASTITGNLSLGNAARTFTINDGAAGADLQVDAIISAGGLVKNGDGRLLLTAPNTYTGDTTVNAGVLVVGVDSPNSDVFVNGGLFNPTADVGAVTGTAGKIAPGEEEPATAGAKNFALGAATLDLTLYGPGALADQLQVTGSVDLTGGSLTLTRAVGANFGSAPVVGETFTIIDNDMTDGVTGEFAGLPDGGTVAVNGVTYQIDYQGGTGNDVTLTALSVPVVPPPAVTTDPYAVGAGQAGGNVVRVYNPDGSLKVEVPTFEDNISGGVRTATADVTGDGVPDLIAGSGPGSTAEVRIYDGATGQRIRSTLPFADFQGGVFVAAADFNNDGFDDIVITPDEGGGPRVTIMSGKDGAVLANFFAIDDPNFRGGARASAGDVNGDGTPDLVVSAGFGGGPRIAVYDGTSLGGTPTKLMNDFFAFEQALRNGAYVAAGDLNGDGKADLVFGGGPGGGPRVLALDSVKLMGGDMAGATLANFFAGNDANRGGVRVTAKNLDADAMMDLVVGDGVGAGSHVTAYLGKDMTGGTPPSQASFDAFPGFLGGVFVG